MDGPTRRAVLATSGVLALSACLPGADPHVPRPDPDMLLRRRVAGEIRVLVTAYAAVVAAFPDGGSARSALSVLAAEHEAHVAALAGPHPADPPSPSPPGAALQVPPTLAAATTWLAGLERAAARRRTRQSLRAGSDLARLLAAVGACDTAHAALLDRESRP